MWMVVVTADSTVLSWTDNVLLLTGSLGYSPKWYAFNFSNTQFILNNIFFNDTDYSLELPSFKTGSLNLALFLGIHKTVHLSGCRGLVWGARLGFVLRFRAALVLVVIQARPALLGASLVAQWQRTCLPVWRTQETCIQSIPGSGSSPGGGKGNPLRYPCLDNSMGRGAWQATVCGAAESRACLSDGTHTQLFSAAGHLTTSAHLTTDPVTFYLLTALSLPFYRIMYFEPPSVWQ